MHDFVLNHPLQRPVGWLALVGVGWRWLALSMPVFSFYPGTIFARGRACFLGRELLDNWPSQTETETCD
ncbi:hypothetical protein LX36DRAFT_459916 [Colletotrichum falcatum]|nr:hypothetical protein LX36DRAFT_459916 [Colletotrichum falcatum]